MSIESKSYRKRILKDFWRKKWIPGRSPSLWEFHYRRGTNSSYLIHKALEKLEYEKKISIEQHENLLAMLKSPDRENVYLVISIMAGIVPKHFERRKQKTN